MAEKDIQGRPLEEQNEVFADIMNGLLFNGRQDVAADELETPPNSFLTSADGIHTLPRAVVKFWQGVKFRIACIGMGNEEKEGSPDPDLSVHVLRDDGLEYEAQLESRVFYPVITIVLYFNFEKAWAGPLSVKERLVKSDDPFEPFVNDYGVNLYQIAELTSEQVKLFRSDFRDVADFFVQTRQKGCCEPEDRELAHPQEVCQMLSDMTNDPRFINAYNQKDPKGFPRTLKDVLARIKDGARSEG